jgi:hypothetical protein
MSLSRESPGIAWIADKTYKTCRARESRRTIRSRGWLGLRSRPAFPRSGWKCVFLLSPSLRLGFWESWRRGSTCVHIWREVLRGWRGVFFGQVQSLVAKRVGTCVRRRRVSHIRGSGEHRAFGAPMNRNCTLWTLRVACFESVFFASFLCRFGQRNDVLPRTVANSDKENIRLMQTANAESSNPALTQNR